MLPAIARRSGIVLPSSRSAKQLLLLSILIVASCGKDDPNGPGDDGGDGDPVTLISSADAAAWEAIGSSTGEPPVCLLESGIFQTAGELPEECHFHSRATIDFTPYASARLQCRATRPSMYDDLAIRAYGVGHDQFIVHLAFNSPAPNDSLVDLPIDLRFVKELTIAVDLVARDTPDARPTVADLRVVATPR